MSYQHSGQSSMYNSPQGYSGQQGSYSTDQMHERNIDHIKDERKMKLMQQSMAEQDLDRAKLYGQDQRVPVLESNLESAKEQRRRNSVALETSVQNQQNTSMRSMGYGMTEQNNKVAASKTQNIKSQLDHEEKMRPTGAYSSLYAPSSYYGSVGYSSYSPQLGSRYPSSYNSSYGYSGAYDVNQIHERNIDHIKDERREKLEDQSNIERELQTVQLHKNEEVNPNSIPDFDSEIDRLEKELEEAKQNRRRNSMQLESAVQSQYHTPLRYGDNYGINTDLAKSKTDSIKKVLDYEQTKKQCSKVNEHDDLTPEKVEKIEN